MANLYHNDIYKFEKPINSYWESTIYTRQIQNFEKDLSTNVVVIGGGYTGMSCALSLAEKQYNEEVVLLEAGHIGWGSSGRNAGFAAYLLQKSL